MKDILDAITDEMTEVLADFDARINPDTHPEAYDCMHNRAIKIQLALLELMNNS